MKFWEMFEKIFKRKKVPSEPYVEKDTKCDKCQYLQECIENGYSSPVSSSKTKSSSQYSQIEQSFILHPNHSKNRNPREIPCLSFDINIPQCFYHIHTPFCVKKYQPSNISFILTPMSVFLL